MISKKRLLRKSKLYVILDKGSCKKSNPVKFFKQIKNRGVGIVQLRDKISPKIEVAKLALRIKQLLNKSKVIFIINDFADIAKVVDADGIHIGQDDPDIKTARRILGRHKIIGVSCHSLKQLITAQKNGADYMAIGPVFPTSLKPKARPLGLSLLKKISTVSWRKPIFAVGGISPENLSEVLATGNRRVAVASAICRAKRPALAIKKLNAQLR